MFRDRQQLRRWAARALFVWLFGFATGIVQACLAPNHMDLDGRRAAPVSAVKVVKHGQAAPPTSDLHHTTQQTQPGASGHDDPLVESICQDFCEKAAVAIPPLKSALDKVSATRFPLWKVQWFARLRPLSRSNCRCRAATVQSRRRSDSPSSAWRFSACNWQTAFAPALTSAPAAPSDCHVTVAARTACGS